MCYLIKLSNSYSLAAHAAIVLSEDQLFSQLRAAVVESGFLLAMLVKGGKFRCKGFKIWPSNELEMTARMMKVTATVIRSILMSVESEDSESYESEDETDFIN